MTSIFLNLGEGFKDEKLNIFRKQLEKRMDVVTFDYAREKIELINCNQDIGCIYYLETSVCRKNKNYIRAFCNLVTCISVEPSAVYLMPCAPKELVKVLKEHWPEAGIYLFEYDIMKPAKLI
jgi:5'(3')-deoxyribonucleotidase